MEGTEAGREAALGSPQVSGTRPSHTHDACRPWGVSDLVIQEAGLMGDRRDLG